MHAHARCGTVIGMCEWMSQTTSKGSLALFVTGSEVGKKAIRTGDGVKTTGIHILSINAQVRSDVCYPDTDIPFQIAYICKR